jgi:hypothetical protein
MLSKKIWASEVFSVYFGFENGWLFFRVIIRCFVSLLHEIIRYSLPKYACEFLEMILMVTADHGPAVSGAHNTIVCARAGKDLVSCLASGLLTIVSDTC